MLLEVTRSSDGIDEEASPTYIGSSKSAESMQLDLNFQERESDSEVSAIKEEDLSI